MKKCRVCGEIKEKDKFYRNKKRKDGLMGECKECDKEYKRLKRDAYNLKKLEWKRRNRHKKHAHDKVNQAIRQNIIERPTVCEKCGKTHSIIEAHHCDYSQPLKINWLCKPCHTIQHHGE